jgi:hypothetical protein
MAIGSHLSAVYRHDLTEPLPRRLAELLQMLETHEPAAGNPEDTKLRGEGAEKAARPS